MVAAPGDFGVVELRLLHEMLTCAVRKLRFHPRIAFYLNEKWEMQMISTGTRRVFAIGAGVVLLTLATLLTPAARSEGQDERSNGRYIIQAATNMAKLVNDGEKKQFRLQANTFSTGGAWMTQGTDKWVSIYTVQLTEGRQYRFLAAGDDDTSDLDIDIQDSSGKSVATDVETSATAAVPFTPTAAGRYTVRLRLYSSKNNVQCFCFAAVMAKD
jgi:hypothetical protein